MKFSQIAQSLALVGSAAAATYSNSSMVPHGSGYFYNGEIFFDLVMPNSGFTSFSIASDVNSDFYGFTFNENSFSGVYEPAGTPFAITSESTSTSLDISADIAFSSSDVSANIAITGALNTVKESYVGLFLVSLEGLPQAIQKREDQVFTVTVTATSSVPSGSASGSATGSASKSATTSGSVSGSASVTSTETTSQTTVVTITSCSDNKCTESTETLAKVSSSTTPIVSTKTASQTTVITITSCSDHKCTETPVTTGVTVVTDNETVYTTYCPLTATTTGSIEATSISVTSTGTSSTVYVSKGTTVTEMITYTTTYCDYYTTVSSSAKGTTIAPTTTKAPATSSESPESHETVITEVSCSKEGCKTSTLTSFVTVYSSAGSTYTTVVPLTSSAVTVPTSATKVTTSTKATEASSISTVAPNGGASTTLSTYTGAGAKATASGSIAALFAVMLSMLL